MRHFLNTHHKRRIQFSGVATALVLLSLWFSGLVSAQEESWPPLQHVVADNTGRLDSTKVNSAVGELQPLGVKPLAFLFQNTPGYSNEVDFARAAAEHYNLAPGGVLDPDLFAVVVILDTRKSTILYGDRLKTAMEQLRSNGTIADQIRSNTLNPNLSAGDFTEAFADSFAEAAREINLYRNPPAAPTPAPPVSVDTQGLGNSLLIGLFVLIALAALVVGGPAFFRQRRRAQEAAARSRALREQLAQASNVASDMLTDLDFPADPNQQLQYRFLALALGNERPQQLAQVTAQYHDIYKRIADALALFGVLNQSPPGTDEQVTDAIAKYQSIQATVQDANNFLQRLADIGKEVEEQTAAAPGEVDAVKKP